MVRSYSRLPVCNFWYALASRSGVQLFGVLILAVFKKYCTVSSEDSWIKSSWLNLYGFGLLARTQRPLSSHFSLVTLSTCGARLNLCCSNCCQLLQRNMHRQHINGTSSGLTTQSFPNCPKTSHKAQTEVHSPF